MVLASSTLGVAGVDQVHSIAAMDQAVLPEPEPSQSRPADASIHDKLHPLTLEYTDRALEAEYMHYYSASCYTHYERVAVSVGVVAAFYQLLATGFISGPPAPCGHLMLFQCLIPCLQRGYSLVFGKQSYIENRNALGALSRVMCIGLTAWQLRYCAKTAGGASFTGDLIFRSGVGLLWWYNLTCPLTWKHFVPLQLVCLVIPMLLLNGQTCSSTLLHPARTEHLRRAWSSMESLSFKALSLFNYPLLSEPGRAQHVADSARCHTTLVFFQITIGLAVPFFLQYAGECFCRAAFLLDTRGKRFSIPSFSWQDAAMFCLCCGVYTAVIWELVSAVVAASMTVP